MAEEELDAAGYYVSSHIYCAADFNLAQHRDRCFVVGIRKDLAAGPFECELLYRQVAIESTRTRAVSSSCIL